MENGTANTLVGGNYVEYILPSMTNTYPVLPRLDVGTTTGAGLNNRVGGVIEPKALKLRGSVYFDYTSPDAASRDLAIRLMVLTNKGQRSMPELLANPSGLYTKTLVWDGQAGDSTSYQGCQPYYNQLPVNRKSWNVIEDRIIHLRKGLGVAVAPLPPSSGEVFMSPQRSATFEIVLTAKDLPATLKYDGGLGTLYPTNFAPVFYVGFVDMVGAMNVGDVNNNAIVQIQWTTQLIYEDA